jgi:hypothetical protein
MSNRELLYAPPAHVTDFDESRDSDKLKRAWHKRVRDTIVAQSRTRTDYPGERSFFDALGSSIAPTPVPWFAFPQPLRAWYPDSDEKRWEAADTLFPMTGLRKGVVEDVRRGGKVAPVVREVGEEIALYYRQQDEYCEWFPHKDPQTGVITRIDFTAENPDYWDELVTHDLELAVTLYRRYVSEDVVPEDLVWQHDVVEGEDPQTAQVYARKGDYNRLNKWTTTDGVMHLTHPANNLFAEIVLAAQSTVQRRSPDGRPFTATTLACCAGYGGVRRSSDPNIGFTVNQLVADRHRVALADPVGLYIATLDRDAAGTWEVVRGSEDDKMILRASFIPDAGAELHYGGEIADNMLMNLYAIAEKKDDTAAAPQPEPCRGRCCSYPDRSGVQDYFREHDCSGIEWSRYEDDFIPYPRDEIGGPPRAAVAATGRGTRWSQPFTRAFSERHGDL